MSVPTRDYYSEIICILRIIHRLRKYPWISAQSMDPSIAQADPWISQIHRLRPTETQGEGRGISRGYSYRGEGQKERARSLETGRDRDRQRNGDGGEIEKERWRGGEMET